MTILVSSDKPGQGGTNVRRAYRCYHRVQRITPSGRIYDTFTMTTWGGAVFHGARELAPDASRAIRDVHTVPARPGRHPGP